MNLFGRLQIIFLILFIASCDQSTRQSNVSGSDSTADIVISPDREIENFSIIQTRRGRKKYVANAIYAAIFKDSNQIVATTVEVDFYDDEGLPFSTLTADSGYIDEKTKDMRAVGNVVVVNRDSARLESEELKWDHKREKIVSDQFVKIIRGRDVLTGIGLESDAQIESVEIKKDVKAFVIDVDDDDI